MTIFQKATSALWGFASIIVAIVMLIFPAGSYVYVLFLLSIGFLASGIGFLTYYFPMARYMVGGKLMLYKGVLLVDFAILTESITDVRRAYVIVYLAAIHAFTGMVEILRAREAGSVGAKSWRLKFIHGFVDIVLAVCCIIFIKKTNTAVFIYSIGLIYSGFMRLVTAFRKSAFVYIQ